MLSRIYVLTFFLLLAVLCSSPPGLTASDERRGPFFTDIIVTTSDTHLLLFGELRNSLTDEMIEGLHSGIPIRFEFFVNLEKDVPNWPDDELADLRFSHTLSYDTLKGRYIVETEESSKKKHSVDTLEEAVILQNEINGLEITSLSSLEPERMYRLRVKADLFKKTLPLSLQTIIPFISWWDLKTDWYTIEFLY